MENLKPSNIASFSSVNAVTAPPQRTEWAERHVDEILSLPFFSEFVFRNVQTVERRKREQVADFLIAHRGTGILIEQKCQEDPTSRTAPKVDLWARKKAKEGWAQMRRAFTRRGDFLIWCDHRRRGRVEFRDGLPPIQHGIVAVEVFQPVDLDSAESLPLDHNGIPITYISLNDFLNLADLLRSVPELIDYLSARRVLPPVELRRIGDERDLLSFYLLNDGSFAGCDGISDARHLVATQGDRLRDALERKFEADQYAHLMEHVADALARRHPSNGEGVPESFLAEYDPAAQRRIYLEMQAALADLHLRERSELGRVFHGTSEHIAQKDRGFVFRAARFDSMPEWVYVVAAAKNFDRTELLLRITSLMGAAMAFYEKPKCLVLVDRDGDGYEVALSRPGARPAPEHVEAGKRLFGGLRTTSMPLNFLPGERY